MNVLILGGTGAGGQSLIRRLRRGSIRTDLTVISRTATAVPGVGRVLTGHYGDLIASAEFRRELAGFDAIVHLADGLSILQQPDRIADHATADRLLSISNSLAVAAREARVPLFLYVSSIKALCDEDDARVLVETSGPHSTTLYGQSKLRLERRLAGTFEASDTRLVIVRNPLMYGGAKAGSMGKLLNLVNTPLPLPFANVANKRSLLALDNFASAMAAILTGGDRPGGVFHVHDGPALSTTEIVTTLRLALGRRRRLFAVSTSAASVAGQIPGVGAFVRRLYGSLELSDTRFRQCFGWTPVIDSRAALCEMVKAVTGRTATR